MHVLAAALLAALGGAAADAAPPAVAAAEASATDAPPAAAPRDEQQATSRRGPARATRAGFVLELRSDFGFERLVTLEFSNDRVSTMNINDGLGVAAGLSFLPIAGGRAFTRATVGFKLGRLRASNGSAIFTAFPVDLMECAYVGPFRFGAGGSVLLSPRVSGKGILDQASVAFGPAPGAVVDAEWIVAPRARTGIGLRASWYRFASRGEVRGAPSLGLVMRADFDLAPRRTSDLR